MISADLAGCKALVTAASSGIGLATLELFARSGAKVALNHLPDDPRGPEQVDRLRVDEARRHNGRILRNCWPDQIGMLGAGSNRNH